MRIDVVTIFPGYLDPLRQSLPGKAIDPASSLAVHDLRRWTHECTGRWTIRHTAAVPGMVMKAPVWGAALDEICSDETLLVVPTPAGRLFTQADAQRWSAEKHLVFACGRTRASTNASSRTRPQDAGGGDLDRRLRAARR